MMGNTVLWKPSSTAVYSGHLIMEIFKKAGLPDGVINFIPGSGAEVGTPVLNHPDLAGVHFTGSTKVFKKIWTTAANNLDTYRSYPRIVGETGGKNFVFIHNSADLAAVVTALVRGCLRIPGAEVLGRFQGIYPGIDLGEDQEKACGYRGHDQDGLPRGFFKFSQCGDRQGGL